MSNAKSNNPPNVKPFGDTDDPRGFYQLLLAHVTWLAVHNFSKTTVEKRALYVKAFALWCIDCDLTSLHVITKPILEAFQRHLFSYYQSQDRRQTAGLVQPTLASQRTATVLLMARQAELHPVQSRH